MSLLVNIGHPGMAGSNPGSVLPEPVMNVASPSGDLGDPPNISTSEITFSHEYTETASATTTSSPAPAVFGDTGKLNGFVIQKVLVSTARLRLMTESGNAGQMFYDMFASSYINSSRNNIAMTVRQDGTFAYGVNGAVVCTRSGLTKPTSYNDGVSVGRYNNTSVANAWSSGTAHRTKVYNRGLGDTELEEASKPTAPMLNPETYPPRPTAKAIHGVGQSNESGRGGTSYPTYTNAVRMKKMPVSYVYGDYSEPVNASTSSIHTGLSDASAQLGAGGYLLDAVLNVRPDIPELCYIPSAVPSTSWAQQWGPRVYLSTVAFSLTGTTHFGASLHALLCRLVACRSIIPAGAMVVHLGEQDCVLGTTSASIIEQATLFVPIVRRLSGNLNLPIVFCGMHAWHSDLTGSGITQEAWEARYQDYVTVASRFDNVYAVDLSDLAGTAGDRIHMTGASQAIKGQRLANILAPLI